MKKNDFYEKVCRKTLKRAVKTSVLTLLVLFVPAFSADVVLDKALMKPFGKALHVNAKIVQLSNQKQMIVSRLGGHLEKYFVEPGSEVKNGDPIAKIESLELSRMSSEFLALAKKVEAAKERLQSTKKLFEKGLASRQDLNREQIALASIEAKRDTLASQLASLDIEPESLKKPTDTIIVRAHADGVVSRLLVPLHTNLGAQTPIVSLVQKSGYYAIAYISVREALNLPKNLKGELQIGDERFSCRYLYLMPKVDEETQRAQMLFWIESGTKPLLLNAFAQMEIDAPPYKEFVAVKRSALTMFEGEWVVFLPHREPEHADHEEEKEHAPHENHADHEGHDHHDSDEEHGDHEKGNKESGHGEHHEEKSPFEARAVEVVATFGEYAAVKGLKPNETYVSDGVYFVKSLMLKSELGGHGH